MGNSEVNGDVEVVFTPWPYDAVARGVALLDEKVPGWRERVNPGDLVMESCTYCVIGQVLGDFDAIIELGNIFPPDYGFDITSGFTAGGARWRLLNTAWKEALTEGSK